jgi:hypothetical protein
VGRKFLDFHEISRKFEEQSSTDPNLLKFAENLTQCGNSDNF